MAVQNFNVKKMIEAAEIGELSPSEIRQAIRKATTLGLYKDAKVLSEYLVQAKEFAADNAPKDLKERVAKGISLLKGLGYHPNRTEQKLRRRGVLVTLGDIAMKREIGDNFKRMISAGYINYTTEAIVCDYPQFFSDEAVKISKEKLEKYKKIDG